MLLPCGVRKNPREVRQPPLISPSASPVRGHGSPPPGGRSGPAGEGDPNLGGYGGFGPRVAWDGGQMSRSQPWKGSSMGDGPVKIRNPAAPCLTRELVEDNGEIEEFFGQLWYIPSSASRVRVPQRGTEAVWIRRDLWKLKKFEVRDCYSAGSSDRWSRKPKKLSCAADLGGKRSKESFVQVLRRAMAGRGQGRARGPRPGGYQGADWGWRGRGEWFPPNYPPPPFFHPPPPFGFYNNQGPSMDPSFFHQQRPPRPSHSGSQAQGQAHRPRGQNLQGGDEPTLKNKQPLKQNQKVEVSTQSQSSSSKVVCHNCGDGGHFSNNCNQSKLCFICKRGDHVVKVCPEWKKPSEVAQYLGSANKGLGFFHIDVAERTGRVNLWVKFENCAILTIEEGDMNIDSVVESLKNLFDPNWPWQLRPMDDYRYLVKFPPHKKVSDIVISNVTFFNLNKEGVLGSLRKWNGEVEPLGELEEVWIQVRGIPPKWSDWMTFRQIASTLGKLVDIDWSSLYSSYFEMIRLKIACKDPSKVPPARVMEMDNKLYLLNMKVEGLEFSAEGEGEDKDDGDDNGDDKDHQDDFEQEDADGRNFMDANHFSTPKAAQTNKQDSKERAGSEAANDKRIGSKTVPLWVSLFQENEMEVLHAELSEVRCANLLRDMELDDSEQEEGSGDQDPVDLPGENELVDLPQSWQQVASELQRPEPKESPVAVDGKLPQEWVWPDSERKGTQSDEGGDRKDDGDATKSKLLEAERNKVLKKGKKKWGPFVSDKRSKRVINDGRTMLERAQDLKKKVNLELPKEWCLVQHEGSLEEDSFYAQELENSMSYSVPLSFRAGALQDVGSPFKTRDGAWLRSNSPKGAGAGLVACQLSAVKLEIPGPKMEVAKGVCELMNEDRV
ncbi:uncharacterized protein LOC133906086 [Phragmites australis]|uniref:uncharacterized protein LOC133906086 n=1 Tax=Phragmites australis TaxID=29695 RepID=UPI002D770CBB|nr:uncharacterized protein LOC133906086 [Phragmites australis]